MIRLVLAITALFIAGLWLTAPTAADVAKCVETTNYTAERCQFELSR